MAKKNAKKTPSPVSWPVVRRLIIGITGLLMVGAIYQLTQYFLFHSSFFKVKTIVLSPTLSVIDRADLLQLQGRSLVGIDIVDFYHEINEKYPQISELRIYKMFPDKIRITGFARKPFAQIAYKSKFITVDRSGVALGMASLRQPDLFLIKGLQNVFPPKAGSKLDDNSLASALEVLRVFEKNETLKDRKLLDVDAGNLSKIVIRFARGPDVIIDWTEIPQKSQMLSVVMSQMKVDAQDIRYVDLRFKEPVIGRE